MEASVVELRYRMADVLKALERQEAVRITHRGRLKGILYPAGPDERSENVDHPFFGMCSTDDSSVEDKMNELREGRYRDL